MMMELGVGSRRHREITGPTPHGVAIRAKPTLKRPKEYLILERRKEEEWREGVRAMVDYNRQHDLKTVWEQSTDKKIQKNTVQRRVEGLLRQQRYSLEERRDKLRDLLQSEEESYLAEAAAKQETVLERQARMRERAKFLKEKREAERLALVEKKLDQRWRDQCEELRSVLTKRHQDEVCRERAFQLQMQAEQKQKEAEEENMYAKLWERDHLAKCKREEMETALQLERNRAALEVLKLQTAAIEKQRADARELKEEEIRLRKEEEALRALELQREKEAKRNRQDETKACLDYSLKLKMKKKAREVQEELSMDMKMLEQMLTETSNEAQEQLQKKTQLREEIKLYREYLAKQAIEEEKRAREVDDLVTSEVRRQWAKRAEQWKKEKEARKKLMKDVIDTRRKQIEERKKQLEREKQENEEEGKALMAKFEEHKQLQKKQEDDWKKKQKTYQDDLMKQIQFQKAVRDIEKEQEQWMLELNKQEELLYKQRVQEALLRPSPDKVHPRKSH